MLIPLDTVDKDFQIQVCRHVCVDSKLGLVIKDTVITVIL